MATKPDKAPASGANAAEEEREFPALESLRGSDSLHRLRNRVKGAAAELERLRQENADLQARVHELEEQAEPNADGTVVAIGEDPEDVRERVNEFIEIIDDYLESDQT